ncbi:hypothetical protein [Dysgonomonas sp. 25]|uniref:hypothetical protein n=1 Tax=Dysgonomonas sp. 25 TaxID=2302933 RepID=UPI0013D6B084|nr:hypothetical protein [Dysgonomonas sp. 25]NDV70010.1 hypothetical protein [Dysgonomonas sp. 25]
MKQIILLLVLHISLFSSCQNKSATNDIPYTFHLDEKTYSYKDYEIIPGTGLETNIFPLNVGDSGLLLYYAGFGDYWLDFVKLEGAVKKYSKTAKDSSRHYTYIPTFDKDLGIDNIKDVIFQFKGLKNYNRKIDPFYYDQDTAPESLIDNKKIVYSDKEQEFILTSDYRQDEENPRYICDISLFMQVGDKKQCFFRTLDKLNRNHIYIYISGDYDDDGEGDFILRVENWDNEQGKGFIYYLLYLSSEAEAEELVRHVATCVIPQVRGIDQPVIKGLD